MEEIDKTLEYYPFEFVLLLQLLKFTGSMILLAFSIGAFANVKWAVPWALLVKGGERQGTWRDKENRQDSNEVVESCEEILLT